MIWHMTEHKGKRGWHGPQPYRLTVSSRGYMTGTKLDSRPHPGLGTRTGEEKQARGCVLPWSTAGRLFRCLSDLPELPSHAGMAQWLHLSLCRHDSKEKLKKLTHCNAKELFMWRVRGTCLCRRVLYVFVSACKAFTCCSVVILGVILANVEMLLAWWSQRQMWLSYSWS